MKICKIPLILTFVIFAVGCSGIKNQLTSSSTPTESLPIPNMSQQSPDETPNTIIPAPTSTPSIPNGYNINCVDVVPELPQTHAFEGSILLDPIGLGEPSILDILSESEIYLESENELSRDFDVSPKGKLLAYSRSLYDGPSERDQPPPNLIMEWLVITTSNDEEMVRLPWKEGWNWIIEWLTDELLLMSTIDSRPFVLNPFTGQETQISVNFADIYDIPPHLGWRQYGSDSYVAVDPTMKWAVYPNKDEKTYIIWDLSSGEEATRLPTIWLGGRPPIWSPDGSQFLISKFTRPMTYDFIPDAELYSVSREDWKLTQLTNLGPLFPTGVDINMYSWSPDGSKIVFTIWAFPPIQPEIGEDIIGDISNAGSLAILDTATNIVTFLCINTFAQYPIHWSPDSTQLLVWYRSAEYKDSPALIDLDLGIAVLFEGDSYPMGWMGNAPPE